MKIRKCLLCMALLFVLVFSPNSVNASTDTCNQSSTNIASEDTIPPTEFCAYTDSGTLSYRYGSGELYGTSWKRIVNDRKGINSWIRIEVALTIDCDVDIIMYDKNGNKVWGKNAAFRVDDDGYGEFWCGPDVYKIDIRLSTKNIFVNLGNVVAPYVVFFNVR